jgi:hypothetical protein
MPKKPFLSALLIALIVFGGLPLAENLQGKELHTCAGALSLTQSGEPVSAPEIEWQKEYGTSAATLYSPKNLIQTSDGGYAYLQNDAFSVFYSGFPPGGIVKTDSNYNVQ